MTFVSDTHFPSSETAPGEVAVVLVEQRALVGLRVVTVDVEEPRVALVALDVEAPTVGREAGEGRLELVAGRQVALLAVRRADVQVIQLVATLVAREQDAFVSRGSS